MDQLKAALTNNSQGGDGKKVPAAGADLIKRAM
jgi:hypothetical protein